MRRRPSRSTHTDTLFPSTTRFRSFGGDGLGAVLAELEGGRVVAVGPGAARAVEAVGLVGRQQRLCAVHRYILFDQMFGDVAQRVPAAGREGVGAECFLRDHAANPRAFSRSRRGCAYTRSEEPTSDLQSLMRIT